jgi:cytochrome b
MATPLARGAADAPPRTVRVWDPVVRLFHWAVVTACVLNLFVLKPGRLYHRYVGYAVIGLLLVRLVWGFVGSRYARFADFFPTPGRLFPYLRALVARREPRLLGHNPAAAVMMLALMALLAATAVTGWMSTLDAFWGEDWLEELHGGFANAILVLALVHAAAALIESVRHRENLVWAMITGRKRA